MNYWGEVGGAAEQGVVNEIRISFSTKKKKRGGAKKQYLQLQSGQTDSKFQ